MNQILREISNIGIVPVIALQDAKDARALGSALCKGGITCAEITFRTQAAEEAIRIMAEEFPQMLVGAGTVLTTNQVDRAKNAGAKFIVSPGLNEKVVRYCMEQDILVIPGCATPSEIEQAMELGLDTVKFFPAEAAGGLEMIKAMSAPYTAMQFMPTGGIQEHNLNSYLGFKKVVACGGSWMVKPELIAAGEFDKIEQLSKEAIRHMLGFELHHIGFNEDSRERAENTADLFQTMFGFSKIEGETSFFAGTAFEFMKLSWFGEKGHIAIQTISVRRAMYHLEKQGFFFQMDTLKTNESGEVVSIYFKEEISGFAIHLIQK